MTSLQQGYDFLSKMGKFSKDIPLDIRDNLNPAFVLREYQREAIARFIDYTNGNQNRLKPHQLLFHMATGSGKTLLMAANILHLYNKGYRNFLFFVNSTNIIEKTKENFLDTKSSKYLFNEKLKFGGKEVKVKEVSNFETSNSDDINILFTTIQGLHSCMNVPRENTLTFEDFRDKEIAIISDEAHHINSWTKNKLGKEELISKNTWEHTVNNIFNSNTENIMLEYTATVDLSNTLIAEKYENRIIYEYTLKQFRQDGYSKDVKVLQADLDNIDRMLQAMLLSQYRRKIAEKNKVHLKPVILFKSKTIKESEENKTTFYQRINSLKVKDIKNMESQAKGTILEKALEYFKKEKITFSNLVTELKEDFSEEKCMLLDSNNIDEKKQLKLNSLEDRNNEVRAIFAVDMLNEGWDVLNLFDIVRLYDTRDSKGTKPGKTTIAEAQLIGRGARYFPFKLEEYHDRFKRKFDQEIESDLKVIEELYYHSAHNPKYIMELKIALRATGIMPPQEPKTIKLKVKDKMKNTHFWENGFLFVNKKMEADRSRIKSLADIDVSRNFGPYRIRTGFTQEKAIFIEDTKEQAEIVTKEFALKNFNVTILKKAIARVDFYKFDNLKKYFPKLDTVNEFVDSLSEVRVDVRSFSVRLTNMTATDRLEVCVKILVQLESEIRAGYTDYKGSKKFVQRKIYEVVRDKTLNINVSDDSNQEFGIPMSQTTKENLRLDLSNKDWYVYDENYGTSEEKHFIQFMNGVMNELEEKYDNIYVLRNANLFKIYRFSDGKPTEPDFVLFLREKGKKNIIQYQLFIEPKGTHLLKTDQWKGDFLKEIEDNYEMEILAENEDYKLIGMPFYNEDNKRNFINVFNEKLSLDR